MAKKEGLDVPRWIRYLFAETKKDDGEIEQMKSDIIDIKKKLDILGESVLKLYKKKK